MPTIKNLVKLDDCPSFGCLQTKIGSEIEDSIDEARSQAQDASNEATTMESSISRDYCGGICDVLDVIEGHGDEAACQIDNVAQWCSDLDDDIGTMELALYQQLTKLKEIVDVGERDEALKLITEVSKHFCSQSHSD